MTSIGGDAFQYCSGLTTITIPNSVTSIGGDAFQYCSGLTSVHISDLEAWCNIAFNSNNSNPLTYAHHLFLNGVEIKDLAIPNSVMSIGDYAFSGCSNLTSVTIPNSVTSIGYGTFYYCSSLTSITIPNSVTSIGEKAFANCDIPEVISRIENPFVINTNIFSDNTFLNATLYVPQGTIDKYKAIEGWKKFAFIEEENGGGETPETQKCATPTIAFENGKLVFDCETEDVEFVYSFSSASANHQVGNNVSLPSTYTVTVYATKEGYENSETVTKEIDVRGMMGDMNGDGTLSVTDVGILITTILQGE